MDRTVTVIDGVTYHNGEQVVLSCPAMEDGSYQITDDPPRDGDFVWVEVSDRIWPPGVWVYRSSPCPLPYWGNPKHAQPLRKVT